MVSNFIACVALAQGPEGVLARCGASEGTSYFFEDEVMNPDGASWEKDGLSNGKIVLVRLGEEWDIQFDDVAGAGGYRQEGATVLVLGGGNSRLTLGAFSGTYTDVYTFDFTGKEVVWTSHKTGTAVPKVGMYHADCDFMATF